MGIWTIVPKCPLCLAAHLALWTGLGLSLSEATLLRWTLLGLAATLVAWVAIRRARAVFAACATRPQLNP